MFTFIGRVVSETENSCIRPDWKFENVLFVLKILLSRQQERDKCQNTEIGFGRRWEDGELQTPMSQ